MSIEEISPKFIIIGICRSGTTSALEHLNTHPNICVLSQLHFF